MMKVLGIGEIMIQLNPINKGPLRHANVFERRVAGSEATVIIGMSRLGFDSAFFTAVGKDELGQCIVSTLDAERVNTKFIKTGGGFTPVYFVQRGYPVPGKTDVLYYRKGSAFSKVVPKDINEKMLDETGLIFVSGITPALSQSCFQTARNAVSLAKGRHVKFAFDTNIRKKLLPDKDAAAAALNYFIQNADILITGMGDLEFMFPGMQTDVQISMLKEQTKAELIVLKMGERGSKAYKDSSVFSAKSFRVDVVDELGAGDAFDAAFLSSILKGMQIDRALTYGNAAGAIAVGSIGDIEPLPNWKDLDTFLSFQKKGEKKLMR